MINYNFHIDYTKSAATKGSTPNVAWVYPTIITNPITEDKNRAKCNEILQSSFESIRPNIEYVEKLISEVEEVMDGKREVVGWSVMEGMYEVLVKRDVTICFDDSIGSDFQGELPTSEIYALLKDWLEFLKEYYKRSFVPLEWIKEEYLEEAKKLQKPING